jgi:hypothetical protein
MIRFMFGHDRIMPAAQCQRTHRILRLETNLENMTEQAVRPLNLKGEFRGVDKCGPKWPGRGPKHRFRRERESSNTVLLQRYSGMERVTGIEPALSAWEEFLSPRVSLSCNGFGGLT